nr:phytochrome B [Tanacetum cinerariifolium]
EILTQHGYKVGEVGNTSVKKEPNTSEECNKRRIRSILDELLEEFRDKLLDITVVDEEADCKSARDIEELERLLAK